MLVADLRALLLVVDQDGLTHLGHLLAHLGHLPRALLALSEQIASASPAQSAAQLTAKLSRHKMLIQFGRLHALIDAAKYPTIAAKIIARNQAPP